MSENNLDTPESNTTEATEALVGKFQETMTRIRTELGKVIVGQDEVLEQLLITVLVGGHCLITGLPGTAKTLMVQCLADALGLDFKRIQFTPDLMPTDVTGTDIIDTDPATGERTWRFVPGPVFTNVLLADEINRTPPKTQSALLEAMQEASVSIRGTTHRLQPPFVVLATQNPIELEGTYPLPEAQLDRFIFNVVLDYLDADEEVAVVERNTLGLGLPEISPCTDVASLLEIQRLVRQVPISDAMNRFAVDLVRATRPHEDAASDRVRSYVSYGASVRAAIFLSLTARARALLNGRYHVTPDDIRTLALPILRHRLQLNYLAESDQVDVDELVSELLDRVENNS
ncbi:MAG: MoxR family ATPase [Gammaproteobacteria bacterium]|nr:MAG: MoxR family ATPase [Gammaproteobacteria bacterium]TDJ39860.1 MAG: MoxR family ATPase [Gammaproteobacteria bacterium]